MHRISLAVALVFLACGSLLAQKSANAAATPACNITEIYRADGWTIPGLQGAKPLGPRRVLVNIPYVFITPLKPGNSPSMFAYYFCSPGHSGRLEIMEFPIGVYRLFSFDVDGRVFAYYIEFVRERFENGTRVDVGAVSMAMFYDLDGSGRFTLRRVSSMSVPEFVPDWVRKDLPQVK